jgi:hypothetical protein
MEKAPVNFKIHFDMKYMEKAVPEFVRERAKKAGSYVIYMKNNELIKEDPRTGEKIVIPDEASKKQ